jgi:hypothetical protein
MKLTIQQGDYVVDLAFMSSIEFDLETQHQSAEVKFALNPHDDEFVPGETYAFEDEDYVALVDYLAATAHR